MACACEEQMDGDVALVKLFVNVEQPLVVYVEGTPYGAPQLNATYDQYTQSTTESLCEDHSSCRGPIATLLYSLNTEPNILPSLAPYIHEHGT